MKKVLFICFLGILSFFNCEDIIQVELDTAEPRLVVDGTLAWIKGTSGNLQEIRLTLTAPFFDTIIPPATGATVTVTDEDNNVFNFTEKDSTGKYRNQSFRPTLNGTYTLNINYNNEAYIATETLIPVVPIESVEERPNVGFAGDETEIRAFYTDPKGVKNYYLFEFINPVTGVRNNELYDDEFTDGNRTFGIYFDDDFKTGDSLIIANEGISKQFHEYVNVLLQQINIDDGDPFQTQPAIVRGNCINTTNPDNFALGYFRASEVSVFIHVFE
ncbi:DUF4249 domain-containing protein [Algibacter sp. 2305UL17-15]|uniref:DUF4249 domain-containing protein n=1 Tax=Algibacter sp. 2305UL17-15 TaxID=3231268 RepID=UPI00345ACFB9